MLCRVEKRRGQRGPSGGLAVWRCCARGQRPINSATEACSAPHPGLLKEAHLLGRCSAGRTSRYATALAAHPTCALFRDAVRRLWLGLGFGLGPGLELGNRVRPESCGAPSTQLDGYDTLQVVGNRDFQKGEP
eukprot:scaffold81780_cov60-Phaeocystis_antarctica.AAC.1